MLRRDFSVLFVRQGRDRTTRTRASSFVSPLSLALPTDYVLPLLAVFLFWLSLIESLSRCAAK